jgi:hypothetical protein
MAQETGAPRAIVGGCIPLVSPHYGSSRRTKFVRSPWGTTENCLASAACIPSCDVVLGAGVGRSGVGRGGVRRIGVGCLIRKRVLLEAIPQAPHGHAEQPRGAGPQTTGALQGLDDETALELPQHRLEVAAVVGQL